MKTTQALLFSFFFFSGMNTAKAQIIRLQEDKVKHFAAGALISGSVQMLTYELTDSKGKSMLFGFGAGCVAGVAKELYDMTGRGNPSFKDALWTGVGAGVASISMRYTLQTKKQPTAGL